MGTADGVVIFDESGFIKKGNESIGVDKEYCGSIGKVENCQVGVFAAYASPSGYALLDKRLFFPQKWFSDDYKFRREKYKLPENIEFKTKPQLTVDMFNNIVEVRRYFIPKETVKRFFVHHDHFPRLRFTLLTINRCTFPPQLDRYRWCGHSGLMG